MPGDVRIEVVGAREVRRAIRQISDKAEAKGLRGGLKRELLAAAEIVATQARREAPKRSGRLAGSVKAKATTTGARVEVGNARVPYAGPIHWGWPNRRYNKRRRIWGGPIPANQFVTRAVDIKQDAVRKRVEDGMRRIIREVGAHD